MLEVLHGSPPLLEIRFEATVQEFAVELYVVAGVGLVELEVDSLIRVTRFSDVVTRSVRI